jgi:hypothetical protein
MQLSQTLETPPVGDCRLELLGAICCMCLLRKIRRGLPKRKFKARRRCDFPGAKYSELPVAPRWQGSSEAKWIHQGTFFSTLTLVESQVIESETLTLVESQVIESEKT